MHWVCVLEKMIVLVLFLPARLDPGIEGDCGLQPPVIDTIWTENHPLLCLLQRWVPYLIKSGYMESCLAAQKLFLLFKGPG